MKTLKLFIAKNKAAFVAAAVIFFAGSLYGAICSCNMSADAADALKKHISVFLEPGTAASTDPWKIFSADALNHIKYILAALICASGTYLIPVFCFVLATKGYQLGFSAGFISAYFGTSGTVLALSSTLFSYVFSVPLYFFIFVLLIRFLSKRKRNPASISGRERTREYFAYILSLFIVFSLLCLTSGAGAFLTPLIAEFLN